MTTLVLQPPQLLIAIRAVSVPQVSGCTIASPAWRRRSRAHGRARRQAGHRERPRRARKTPPLLTFSAHKESDKRPRVCRRDAPGPTNAFAAESGRPTTFSVRTGHPSDRPVAPSLHPRGVASFLYITTGPCCVDPAGRQGFRDPKVLTRRKGVGSTSTLCPRNGYCARNL
jgi:hypothetical protein